MILQCPECNTRFLVNDALIPVDGRMVRCGKCTHTWHVSPSAIPMEDIQVNPANAQQDSDIFASFDSALASATAEEADDMAESAASMTQLPAIAVHAFKAKQFIVPLAALALLVCALVPFAFYPSLKHAPVFSALYAALGWKDTQGLEFADINMTREENEAKTQFILAGNIVNHADSARVVPAVRVALNDKEGETLWSREYAVDKALKPGEVYPFRITNVETAFGDKVSAIMVDVGNGYELMVR